MNINTTIPAACQQTDFTLPTLPYAMSCGTALHDNGTYADFAACCGNNTVATFGGDDPGPCWVGYYFDTAFSPSQF
jgi:hypothetical protein